MAKWMFTDATERVDCPKCGAIATRGCVTPNGRYTNKPHDARVLALQALPDYDPTDYQVPVHTIADIMKEITGS